MSIDRSSLLSLEDYAKVRPAFRAEVIPHRRLRTVHLGEHVTLQFEDELTIRYHIQEMLRVEKIFEEDGIRQELEVYAPLIPDGGNWKATMLVEYVGEEERKHELGRLLHIEDRVWVRIGGFHKNYAIADEDMERETAEKTSSVHFLRFELSPVQIAALRGGALLDMGVDHVNYEARVEVGGATRAALLADLSP
jgi:hypothetical protein